MSDSGNVNGVRVFQKIELKIVYDTGTHSLGIEAENVPIALGQMMLDEAQRILSEKRRLAAALQLQKDIAENQRVHSILERGGRG